MSINWSKPIERVGNRPAVTDIEVLKVFESGRALIYWRQDGREIYEEARPNNPLWRNVPELSERDRALLRRGWNAHRQNPTVPAFHEWFERYAADLAREFGE